jgi:hypothetical protein
LTRNHHENLGRCSELGGSLPLTGKWADWRCARRRHIGDFAWITGKPETNRYFLLRQRLGESRLQ